MRYSKDKINDILITWYSGKHRIIVPRERGLAICRSSFELGGI